MSSNAALSAARRRRVGQPQVQQQSSAQQPTQPQQQPPKPMTPVDVLRQHQERINSLEDELKNINIKETNTEDDQLYDKILSYVTEQFNFKAFQQNLDNVVTEFEDMRKLINSQQIYLNNMNVVIMQIMSKLNIEEQAEEQARCLSRRLKHLAVAPGGLLF